VIQELHWSNYTVAQTINIGTGKVELTIGHPIDMATQTWTNTQLALKANSSQVLTNVPSGAVFTDTVYTHPSSHPISLITGLQAQLNKISSVVDCVSGLSLGDAAGVKQKIACYESDTSGYTPGTYFYGLGLYIGSTVGLALWGGTGTTFPKLAPSGTGIMPHMMITTAGSVGIGTTAPQRALDVVGDMACTGTMSAATKQFDIQHPDPAKPEMRLRHWCVETADCPGGLLMYRRTIDMTSTTATFDMPDWFSHLTKGVIVQVTPYQHFGSAWGECTGNTIELHATTLGKWHVLITACRKDECATTMCPQDVEYIPEEPEDPPPPFPTP
jgi:hypothetical protein